MSNIKFLGLISASVLVLSQAASATEIDNISPHALLDNIQDTHSHTHTLELKPMPFSGYQIASVQFLPEAAESVFSGSSEASGNYNSGDCKDKSTLFTTKNCSYPKAVESSSRCPFLPGYYKECSCLPQFKLSSCPSPKVPSATQCDGKFEKCLCPTTVALNNPNDKCTQSCEGNCIAKSCTPLASETNCKYGTNSVTDNCGGRRSVCKPCNLTACNSLSTKPANSYFTTSSCTDCSGTKTINSGWECISGYHKSGSICAANCSLPNCTNAVSSKPANSSYLTASCTDCSGTKTIYTGWSCNSGYNLSGNACVQVPQNGDILFSDLTTAPDIVAGKTPIGIVLDSERRLAVSIEHSDHIRFVEEKSVPYISGLALNGISGYSNFVPIYESGKENTAILLSFGKSQNFTFSAAEYCNNYKTVGTTKGQWFLPSHYEFIVPLQADYTKINTALKNAGGTGLGFFWTSSIGRVGGASIRMEGSSSFYMDYGAPSDADAAEYSFYRTYAYCGINY